MRGPKSVGMQFVNHLLFKMALGFLLVSLVPLSIVSAFSLHAANQLIESIVTSQLENMAAEKQRLLERWLAERRADVEVVATAAPVRSMDRAEMAPYLKVVQSQYQVYHRFVVTKADGRIVFDTASAEKVEANWAAEPSFQAAIGGRRWMSDVHMAPGGRVSVFELAAPIVDPEGKPQGMVCATVSTPAIAAEVLSVSLGETGECYLVDKTGTLLAHQDPRRILRDNIAQSESFAYLFREKGPRPVYRDYRGIMVLGASRAISGTPWYLVVEQDEDEAFAGAYALRRTIWIFIGLTAVGAIAISGGLAYYLAAPIRALHQSARAMGAGEFDEALRHLPGPRRDEIGTLRDAFAEMARQLRDRQSTLEHRVGFTEAELHKADERLQSTIAAAARSEQLAALGRLASGVAHEIRTPLTSLKLYLQSVKEEFTISPEHAEDFEVAMRQVKRIEATINHFLNFARPQDPILVDVDFRRLVDDALEVVRPRAIHQSVEIDTAVAADLPRVAGDVRQLGEVLVNLMVNALEEMPGGGRLRITVGPETNLVDGRAEQWVRMDVADNGPGIKPADQDLLFEPFFTTKAAGSGLGLAIVRGTVQRHGGIVRVKTQPGAGTTFSVFLPAATA